LGRSRAELHS